MGRAQIDIWVVDARLGSGGMGTVYRCHNRDAPRIQAAIKVLDVRLSESGEVRRRFIREAELLFELDHPHIVKVRNIRMDVEPPFIEMAFVQGRSLREHIERRSMTPGAAAHVVRQVASALDHCHARGVRHRDVKPSNILVSGDQATLVDFGIAAEVDGTLTSGSGTVGTMSYTPPEWGDADADSRLWDTYSLGVVFYELLTGRMAFPTRKGTSLRKEIVRLVSEKQEVAYLDPGEGHPEVLRDLVRQLTSNDPSRRPSRLQAVADTLAQFTAGRDDLHFEDIGPAAVDATDEVPPAAGADAATAADAADSAVGGVASGESEPTWFMAPAPGTEPTSTGAESPPSPKPPSGLMPWRGLIMAVVAMAGLGAVWLATNPAPEQATGSEATASEATLLAAHPPPLLSFDVQDDSARDRFEDAVDAFHRAQFPLAERLVSPIIDEHPEEPAPQMLRLIVRTFLGVETSQMIHGMDHIRALPREDHAATQLAGLVFALLHRSLLQGEDRTLEDFADWAAPRMSDYDTLVVTTLLFERLPVPLDVEGRIGWDARAQELGRHRTHPLTHVLLARHARNIDDDVAMQAALDDGIASAQDPAYFLFLQGQQARLQGHLEQARSAYVDVLKHDPGMYMAREMLANVLLQLGEEAQRLEQVGFMQSDTVSPTARASFYSSHSAALIPHGRLDAAVALLRLRAEISWENEAFLELATTQIDIARGALLLGDTAQYRAAIQQLRADLSAPELPQESRQGLSTELFIMESIDAAWRADRAQVEANLARLEKKAAEEFMHTNKTTALVQIRGLLHWAEQDWAVALKYQQMLEDSTPEDRCKNQPAVEFVAEALEHTQGPNAAIHWLSQPFPEGCATHPHLPQQLSQRAAMEWEQGQAGAARATIQAFDRLWPQPDPDLPAVVRLQEVRSQLPPVR